LTCSVDGQVLVWDLEEFLKQPQSVDKDDLLNRVALHDLQWSPVYGCTLVDSVTSIPYPITKLCFFFQEERLAEGLVKVLCSTEV
jgi:hypothetical protein